MEIDAVCRSAATTALTAHSNVNIVEPSSHTLSSQAMIWLFTRLYCVVSQNTGPDRLSMQIFRQQLMICSTYKCYFEH